MSVRITEIGGQRFVAGLFWQTLSQKDRKKEAQTLAEDLRFDFVVFRNSEMPQVGFAASEDGAEEGLLSIAAMISKSMEMEGITGNWMGAFGLPDGEYVYVAIRDDIFLSDGDMIGSEQEIRQIMSTTYSLGDWDYIFAPPEFNFSSSEERDIESLIPTKRGKIKVHKWWALQPANKKGSSFNFGTKQKAILATAVLLGVAMIGAKVYQQKQVQKEAAERAKAMQEARAKMFGEQAAKQKALEDAAQNSKPWADMILPSDLAMKCLHIVSADVSGAGGWQLKQAVCDQQNFVANYDRGNSTIENLLAVIPDAQIDASGDKATISRPIGAVDSKLSEKLTMLQDSKLALLNRSQQIGATITIQDPPPPPPPLPGTEQASKPVPVPPWKKTQFSMDSKLSPEIVANHIAVPGLRVTKITMDGALNAPSWKIEGELYGN